MDPNLIAAIQDRLSAGRSIEEITAELVAAGYSSEQATAAVQHVAQSTSSAPTDTGTPTGTLIGYWALIKTSWQLCLHNLSLFGRAAVAYVLATVAIFGLSFVVAMSTLSDSVVVMMVAGLVLLGLLVALFTVPSVALMRALLHRQTHQGFWSAYQELFPQFWRLLLLAIIWQLVIYGGYFALFVPGIALSGYLLFAMLRFADVGAGGFQALSGSYQLVTGRWWSVFGRMLFFGVVLVLGTFALFLLPVLLWGGINMMALSTGATNSSVINEIMIPMLFAIGYLGVMVGMLSLMMSAMVVLYESLRDTTNQTVLATPPSRQFRAAMMFFMVLGVALFGLQIVVAL